MKKLITDAWLMFSRNISTTLRNPVRVLFGLFQPLCFLLLFGPLFATIISPTRGNALGLASFVPGLMVWISIFGTSFAGFSVIADLRAGIVERFQVTPVSRLALLLGRALHDIALMLIQAIIILVIAGFLGMKASLMGVALSLVLIALVGLSIASCSYMLGLAFKSEHALVPVINFFLIPLYMLSGIMLPLTFAPPVLKTIAFFNPIAHTVSATRSLFAGTFAHVMPIFMFMLILAVITVYFASRSFGKAFR